MQLVSNRHIRWCPSDTVVVSSITRDAFCNSVQVDLNATLEIRNVDGETVSKAAFNMSGPLSNIEVPMPLPGNYSVVAVTADGEFSGSDALEVKPSTTLLQCVCTRVSLVCLCVCS